jgi:hypothetical protein
MITYLIKKDFSKGNFSHKNRSENGIALVMSLLVLILLTSLVLALMTMSITENRIVSNFDSHIQALYVAEAGMEEALATLESRNDITFPYNSPRTNFGNGAYWYNISADGETASGLPQFRADQITIISTAEVGKAKRRIVMKANQLSLMDFSRYVDSGDVSYAANAVIYGMLYAGSNLNCPNDPDHATFKKEVTVGGTIYCNNTGVGHKGPHCN